MLTMSRQPCQPYKRSWWGYCVDAGIEDAWLTRLNNLQAFRLVGICEGHPDRTPRSVARFPHINLHLRDHLLSGIAEGWEGLRTSLLDELASRFVGSDIQIRLELRFRLRSGRGQLVYQQVLTCNLRSTVPRTTIAMDDTTRQWLERALERLEHLDEVVAALHRARAR